METKNLIDTIVIHQSDSRFGNRNLIDQWHKERGWSMVGYHFIILNGLLNPKTRFVSLDGSIEIGRQLDTDGVMTAHEQGSHALGYNGHSIGICIIGSGGDPDREPDGLVPENMTVQQFHSLLRLIENLQRVYNIKGSNVIGHNETEHGKAAGKTCPGFPVAWLRKNYLKVP